ncbi:Pex24p-domain-containing protein [Sarocladium strictum]
MDDFGLSSVLEESNGEDTPRSSSPDRRRDAADSEAGSPQKSTSRAGGFGFAAIREKASIQDRLVEKLLQQVIPTDVDNNGSDAPIIPDPGAPAFAQRPNFTIPTMSNNFRRFNARIGVVFIFQARALRLLAWRRPSHTLSFLAVYTFVCLDPYMLPVLPIAALLLGVLVPAFVARHPAPPKNTLSSEQGMGYSPRGPPLAPAATVRPVKELSKDFFRNMRDLQNCMEDFSRAHDKIIALLVPVTNFSNEALSSALFLVLFTVGVFMSITSHLLPWRFIFLLGGWAAVLSSHPHIARLLAATHESHVHPHETVARGFVDNWIANDVILDTAPETREVEIFELQKMARDGGEWEPWVFSPSPYDPLSQPRIAGDRPGGTRFFEDVLPPHGWEWSEKKWALDLWSREWVEERIITGVEVETEGERWVYDIWDDAHERTGVVDHAVDKAKAKAQKPSWEEGEDGNERRGDWRRRRWVRLVKRRVSISSSSG